MSRIRKFIEAAARGRNAISISIDDLVPPPKDTIYVSPSGCIVMSVKTFEELRDKAGIEHE